MAPLDHGEPKGLAVDRGETCQGADSFTLRISARERWPSFAPNPFCLSIRAELRRVGRGQNTEVAVDVADTTEARDHFLADVTALGGADGVGLKAGLRGEGVGVDIDSPEGEATGNPQRFPGGQRRGVWFPRGGGGNPKVESRFSEAGGRKREAVFGRIGRWGGEIRKMGEMERVGYVFDGDVVGDDELFQAGAEGVTERGIGFHPKGILGGADAAVGLETAFGGNHRSPNSLAGLKFFKILGDLAVEKADSVRAGEFEQGTRPRHPGPGGRFDLLKKVGVHQNRQVTDEHFMDEAIRQARKAAAKGEVPVGAVLVVDGRILAKSHNQVEELQDATAHAEMLAVTTAAGEMGEWRLEEATVYVTKEPCPMCAGAMSLSRVRRVVYGAADPKMGAAGGALNLLQFEGMNHRCEVRGGVRAEECRELLREFFQKQRAEKSGGGK